MLLIIRRRHSRWFRARRVHAEQGNPGAKMLQNKAVKLVRQIRDRQAELLRGKPNGEIIEFFRKAGEEFKKITCGKDATGVSKGM
ncbi:MAG TPA: hypothetical protein PLZ55_07750 [bacterium]|nr:hypothetical protein [bacterium]